MNYRTALVQLPLVCEAGGRHVRNPADAAAICADIRDLAQETFHVLLLNSRNSVIDRQMVSLGIVDSTLLHPREVFRTAIQRGASALVLVHNHPSGDPAPSAEDIRITRQMVEVGRIIDIKVLDHVIVGRELPPTEDAPGRQGFLSLRENGTVTFQ